MVLLGQYRMPAYLMQTSRLQHSIRIILSDLIYLDSMISFIDETSRDLVSIVTR